MYEYKHSSRTVYLNCCPVVIEQEVKRTKWVQWNLSYPGSVGPRGARNYKIARISELIHELRTYSTWLYKNTG